MADHSFTILTENGVADLGQEQKLEALKQRLQSPNAKLLLHLHGGLVDKDDGIALAERLSGTCEESYNLGPDWTQLYVVWRTGAWETLTTNWTDLVQNDRLYQALLRRLIGFAARRLGIPAPGGTRSAAAQAFGLDNDEIMARIKGQRDRSRPFGDIDEFMLPEVPEGQRASLIVRQAEADLADEFERELLDDDMFVQAANDIDAEVNKNVITRSATAGGEPVLGRQSLVRLDKSIADEFEAEATKVPGTRGLVSVGFKLARHGAKIAYRVFKRFRSNRDHGLHATIVEEVCRELYGDLIGSIVWGMMVKDAAQHFDPDGFGTQLLDILQGVPAPEKFSVSAHSAGSIWASRMMLAMANRNQQAKLRLFLLAPAVRHDLFAEALNKAGNRLELLHMFTMSDALERRDAVLGHHRGYIYPSSLLYLVSGLFEEQCNKAYVDAPLVGMLRHAGPNWLSAQEAAEYAIVKQAFGNFPDSITTAIKPGVCEANSHGGFDNEPKTLATLAQML